MLDKFLTRTNNCVDHSLPFPPTAEPCLLSCLGMLWQNKPTTCWWIIQIWLSDVWRLSCKRAREMQFALLENPSLPMTKPQVKLITTHTPPALGPHVNRRRNRSGCLFQSCCSQYCCEAKMEVISIDRVAERNFQLVQQFVDGNPVYWEEQEHWRDVFLFVMTNYSTISREKHLYFVPISELSVQDSEEGNISVY